MKQIFLGLVLAFSLQSVLADLKNDSMSFKKFGSVPIGGPCDTNADCVGIPGMSSSCDLNTPIPTCMCKDNFVAQINLLDCLPKVHDVRSPCKEPQQCNTGNLGSFSDCITHECHCTENAIKDPTIPDCLPKVELVGDWCNSTFQCNSILGKLAVCNNICTCEKSVENADKTECLPLAEKIGDSCEVTPQCVKGEPGTNSECQNATCVCKAGAVRPENGETCLLEAGFGKRCTDTAQCKATLGNLAICSTTNQICTCQDGVSVPNQNKTLCLPLATEIGAECQVNGECRKGAPGKYSTCNNGTCTCNNDAVQIPGSQTCHKKAENVEELCLFHEQCTANLGSLSECRVGICVCSAGAVVSSTKKCLRGPLLIGESCQDDNQCVANALCTATGQCGCKDNFIPNGNFDRCLHVQEKIGGSCEETVQCHHGTPGELSDCIMQNFTGIPEKVCNCTNDAVSPSAPGPEWNECQRKAGFVGDSCKFTEQCSVPLGLGLCLNTTCVCSSTANPSTDRTKCLKKAELGEVCEDDGQCSHIFQENSASCRSNNGSGKECQCKTGYIKVGSICLKLATVIGETCEHQEECNNLVNSTCRMANGTKACYCDLDNVASQAGTSCLPLVLNLNDEICQENVQCLAPNSECLLNTNLDVKQCRCDGINFVESIEKPGSCIQVVRQFNRSCTEDIQCITGLDGLSECRNFQCQCKTQYKPYNNHCYTPVGLGGFCKQKEECFTGVNNLTQCSTGASGGICECQPRTVTLDNSCWEDKRIGDKCETDKQCRVAVLGDVRCDLGSCKCFSGTEATIDNRVCMSSGIRWMVSTLLILSGFLLAINM